MRQPENLRAPFNSPMALRDVIERQLRPLLISMAQTKTFDTADALPKGAAFTARQTGICFDVDGAGTAAMVFSDDENWYRADTGATL